MNQQPTQPLIGSGLPNPALDIVILPRTSEITAGFKVQRLLPFRGRRMVGPFIFFDQMGPEILRTGQGLDVAPHPHIGLATVTYLFDGQLFHRDSLGTTQTIRPGEVNWMTAGKGIAHSERSPQAMRQHGGKIFGIQSWVALPERDEETTPTFAYHAAETLPMIEGEGKQARLIVGTLFGARSPVATLSETFYADVVLAAGAVLPMPIEQEERALFIVEGQVTIDADATIYPAGQLLVFKPGADVIVKSIGPSRVMILGGAAMEGPRHIWWNFVSSSRQRIEQAKADWREGRFHPVPDETEFVPLPE
ncbi:MAG: pirin family protein [Armatimonadetes bacterium]|nr:pirin family protein [Armatimonadota bacterium]